MTVGLTDGILTALTLASGRLLREHEAIDWNLAWRVATVSAVSGALTYFIAEYARQRRELVRAERHLNLTFRGQLAATRLGRAVFRDALTGMIAAGLCGFLGALLPLAIAAVLPSSGWMALLSSGIALSVLGAGVGRASRGNIIRWSLSLVGVGLFLALLGAVLHVV